MKLSPISVPYRAVQKGGGLLFMLVFFSSTGAAGPGGLVLGLGAIAILAVSIGYELLYYRRFSYELTADTLDLSSGVFNRREREIPYGRIQNVDVSQNIIQRALGIAAVNVETAGGGSTEAVIRYVSAETAETLQADVRDRKRGRDRREGASADEPAAEPESLFSIEPSELALVGVLSFDPRVPGAILALLTGSVPFVSPILPGDVSGIGLTVLVVVVGVAVIGLSWIVGAISAVVNYWGFRLTQTEDELQYERGLVQRYSGTIPFDKVQTVTIEDNPLKRRFGYATLGVETAGYAPGQANGKGSEAAVPLASVDRVHRLAHELEAFGEPEFTRPPKRIRRRYAVRYLLAISALTAIAFAITQFYTVAFPWYVPLGAAVLTPIAAHYKWKHRGYWLGEDHFVARSGFWNREAKVVPYYRIQTVIDTRTIFQRRWNVGTVVADTAGSLSVLGSDAAALDIDRVDVERVREELTDRLQASLEDRRRDRKPASGFAWIDTVEDPGIPNPVDFDSLTPAIKSAGSEDADRSADSTKTDRSPDSTKTDRSPDSTDSDQPDRAEE